MSQSPSSKSYLDPGSAASFDLGFTDPSRGRPVEIGQGFGAPRFPGSSTSTDTGDRRHLGPVLGGKEDEDPYMGRGRVVSNPRGAEILGAARSESLPPQQRANSTPPTYNPNQSPPDGGYGAYTHIPTSHPAPHAPGPGSYPGVHSRYPDLSRETREAEMLAQLRHISVEDNDERFPDGRGVSFFRLNHGQTGNPSAYSFGEYPYQSRQTAQQVAQNMWAPDDVNYHRGQDGYNEQYGDGGYVETYGRPFERVGSMSPSDQNGEYHRGTIGSPYHLNGATPSPHHPSSDFRSPSRGTPVRTSPSSQLTINHEKFRQRLVPTQPLQQPHPNQGQLRGQLYRNQYPVSNPYDYSTANGFRMPMAPFPGSTISPLVAPTHPARRALHEDFGHNLRSVLLEEFRSNSKSNKRYELKVIPTDLIFIFVLFCLDLANRISGHLQPCCGV